VDTLLLGKRNPRLSDIRKAIAQGGLTRDGLLPIEGWKLLTEAHSSGIEISSLFLRSDLEPHSLPAGIPTFALDPAVFRSIQSTETSQGVIALVRPRLSRLQHLVDAKPAPIIVLASLQDPGNVGTVLRVAESFAAAGCIALSGTASLFNPKTIRASAGSIFRLPCVWDQDFNEIVTVLKAAGFACLGTSPHATETIQQWDWRQPSALLIGSEGTGLSPEYIPWCERMLRIPHSPRVESLNSAIAASIVLYEAYKQRGLS
jgi:TrmH family RNA methyltransferase